jgi:hypothetical protein
MFIVSSATALFDGQRVFDRAPNPDRADLFNSALWPSFSASVDTTALLCEYTEDQTDVCPTALGSQVCSGHGTCVARACLCDPPSYVGLDCSVDSTQPPSLWTLSFSACASGACPSSITVSGTNFLNTSSLSCVLNSGTASPARFVSLTSVVCTLPPSSAFLSRRGYPETHVSVAVTNGVAGTSNPLSFKVFDPACQVCDSANGLCRLNGSACAIRGTCYQQREANPLNPCQLCMPSVNQTGFTDDYAAPICRPRFSRAGYVVRILASAAAGQVLTTVNATNPLVPANLVRYRLYDPHNRFTVNAVSGAISPVSSVTAAGLLLLTGDQRFESQLTVSAFDSWNQSASATVAFVLLLGAGQFGVRVPESLASNSPVLRLYDDAFPSPLVALGARSITYAWQQPPPATSSNSPLFAINSSTSEISLGGQMLDYELGPQLVVLSVNVCGTLPSLLLSCVTVNVTVYIDDVYDGPSFVWLTPAQVSENAPTGTLVGRLQTEDARGGNATFSYTLVNSSSNIGSASLFQVVGDAVVTAAPLDFEATRNVTIRVRSTNALGLSLVWPTAISVLDQNEPPTNVRLLGLACVSEDSPIGAPAGNLSVQADDPEG